MRSRDDLAEDLCVAAYGDGREWSGTVGDFADKVYEIADALISRRSPPPSAKWDGHASDCATHNEPATPNGPCDCKPPPAASTPVAYVPKVGDVVKWADGSFPDVEIVIESLRGDGSIEGRELGRDDSTFSWPHARYVKYLRPATSAERIAAGLDTPAPVASEDPRRVVGAVVRFGETDFIACASGDGEQRQRRLSCSSEEDATLIPASPIDVFLRWATPDECARHGIPYVDRSKPVASEARPTHVRIDMYCEPKVRPVLSWHDGNPCVPGAIDGRLDPSSPCTPPMGSWEPAPAPATTTEEDREAAFRALGHNVTGTRDYVDGFIRGYLACAAARKERA